MTVPRFQVEESNGFALVVNGRDFSMPRRYVASFPPHPFDKNEARILADICAEALNRELPGSFAGESAPAKAKAPAKPFPHQSASARSAPQQAAPAAPEPTPLQAYAAKCVARRKAAEDSGCGSLLQVGA